MEAAAPAIEASNQKNGNFDENIERQVLHPGRRFLEQNGG